MKGRTLTRGPGPRTARKAAVAPRRSRPRSGCRTSSLPGATGVVLRPSVVPRDPVARSMPERKAEIMTVSTNTPINPEFADLFVEEAYNPYRSCIQGLSNEPITVRALLRARRRAAGRRPRLRRPRRLFARRHRRAAGGGSAADLHHPGLARSPRPSRRSRACPARRGAGLAERRRALHLRHPRDLRRHRPIQHRPELFTRLAQSHRASGEHQLRRPQLPRRLRHVGLRQDPDRHPRRPRERRSRPAANRPAAPPRCGRCSCRPTC